MADERRNHDRSLAAVPIHYSCADPGEQLPENPSSLPDVGIVVNFSESGLCFIATYPIEVGRNIVVYSPRMFKGPEGGIVKWCMSTGTNLWRVGLQRISVTT